MGGLLKSIGSIVGAVLIQAAASAAQSKLDKLTKPKSPG